MRVLVTGGAGFIGAALVRRLVSDGHEVTVADRHPCDPAVRRIIADQLVGDLTDPANAGSAVRPGLDAVCHLAAATSVLQSARDPAGVYRANVGVTQDLLEACRRAGVGRFVLASTNAVVGTGAGGGTIDEGSRLEPLTPYGATKAAGEMIMSAYRRSYGLDAVALRLTNVYGPGVWVKDGMVARLFKAARSGEGIRINGDGRQVRDYVYLDDVVEAFVAALAGGLPPTLVVGSGESVDVVALHRLVCEATGRDIPAEHVEAPPGEMRAVVVDRSLATRCGLGEPVLLPQGLRATWDAWPD